MFSKSCKYGIKAVVYIAQQSLKKNRVRVNAISEAINSPTAFTAKILQQLAKENIITSVMGHTGGYEINTDQLSKITLFDIVTVIDNEALYNGCGLGLSECNEQTPCPIHNEYVVVRNALNTMLKNTSILTLATTVNNGDTHLKLITNLS